jgi:hypothetical protein
VPHSPRPFQRQPQSGVPGRAGTKASSARRWQRRIESGQAKSITELAEQEGVTDPYVCRLLPLTCLAPDIVEAKLDEPQPKRAEVARDVWLGVAPTWYRRRVLKASTAPREPTS